LVFVLTSMLCTSVATAQGLEAVADLQTQRDANGTGRGGGVQADFDSLIELIRSTIAPNTWDDVGGEGSIMGFPGGVFVDASGVLRQIDQDVQNELTKVWKSASLSAGRSSSVQEIGRSSELRKVSLTRLERALNARLLKGEPPSLTMRLLAGLHRVDYVFIDRENNEVIIAGPAGPWTVDQRGRIVDQESGRPLLRLDDLIVLLRNAFSGPGQFVCAITPTPEHLARTRGYIDRTSDEPLNPGGRDAWLVGLQRALGHQQIEVTGIDSSSRVARVIVEADHHMKLIGIGLEPGNDVTSYLDRIEMGPNDSPPELGVLRWWFSLRNRVIRQGAGGSAFRLARQMVQVLSENELLTRRGQRVHTGESDGLNRAFARSFTERYQDLAAQYPVYAELDNIFRLASLAALLRHEDVRQEFEWDMVTFLSDEKYAVPHARTPREVPSVINHRVIHGKHIVAAVSGGVSFQGQELLTRGLDSAPAKVRYDRWLRRSPDEPEANWWWD
jgi:hypothetical protein